jgi:hypothetical protein
LRVRAKGRCWQRIQVGDKHCACLVSRRLTTSNFSTTERGAKV